MRAARWSAIALGAGFASGCASPPAKKPVERSAVMSALVTECRAGTATYTVKNELARRVAIYQTGGASGPSPRFVDVLNAGESLEIDGLPITTTQSGGRVRISTVYFFGSDDLGGDTRPSPLRSYEQRSIKTSIKCDPPKPEGM